MVPSRGRNSAGSRTVRLVVSTMRSDSADFRAAIDRDSMTAGHPRFGVALLSFPAVRRRSPVSSLMLWAWLVLTAAPPLQPSSVSGTVVDPGGKPVKGATVWLTAFVRFDADVGIWRRSRRTPRAGSRSTPRPAVATGPGSLNLWAHSPGTRVAIASASNRPKDDRGPIRLALGPPARTPVRVLGVDGKPVAGAAVRLSSLRLARRPAGQARGHDRRAGRASDRGGRPRTDRPRRRHGRGARHPGAQRPARTRRRRPCSSCRSAGSRRGSCRTTRRPWPAGRSSPRPIPTRRAASPVRRTRRAAGATSRAGSRSGPSRRGRSPSASSRPRARRSSPCPACRRRRRSAAARASRSRSRSGRGSRSRDRCGSTAAPSRRPG